MITISLCMIVKNEEQTLARCLDCGLQVADEIIVVDTGSTDNTEEIARRYTPHVFSYEWEDDFSAARNFSFSKASCDYILWLDADDVIDDENLRRLRALKAAFPEDVDAALFRYNIEHDQDGNVTFTYFRERLVRRACGFRWSEPVHEYLQIAGVTREFDIAVTHGSKRRSPTLRNLEIYRKLLSQNIALSPRGIFYYARELQAHNKLAEAQAQFRLFLTCPDIWQEDAIAACAGLSDCLLALGKDEEALEALLASLRWDLPRAEILCRIGGIWLDRNEVDKAAYWYRLALSAPRPTGWGFLHEDYWGFIPHMQLCVLCDRLGDRTAAVKHHLAAKARKPSDPAVLFNEEYFFKYPHMI